MKKTKRYNFAFDDRINSLLRQIEEKTDMKLTKIVERAIEDFAKKKGVSYE